MKKIKNIWKSKTIWASSVLAIMAAIQANLTLLEPVMSNETYGLVSFGFAMVLFFLRFVTNKPLEEK